jgi:hypothetical protein
MEKLEGILLRLKEELAKVNAGTDDLEKGEGTNHQANPSPKLGALSMSEGTNEQANPPDKKGKEKLSMHKNGQWNLEADKIEPGREHSRKIPKEEK